MSPSANRELAMYQEIAKEVLKDRKVPQRTKSKEVEGFFTRAMGLLGLQKIVSYPQCGPDTTDAATHSHVAPQVR